MTDETTEQIPPTEKTLEQPPTLADVMKALNGIAEKLDSHDIQFEAIRSGLAAHHIAFERLAGKVYLMSANLAEIQEQARRSKETII